MSAGFGTTGIVRGGTLAAPLLAMMSVWNWLFNVPQSETTPSDGSRAGGRDTVLVIDASHSMESPDWPPTRLRGGQDASRGFVERLAAEEPDARVAVVAYGTDAEVCCELTPAGQSTQILYAIERLDFRGNTNMRAALKLTYGLLRKSTRYRQVVFLTDGLNTQRDPEDIAAKLRKIAVVNCVGIGDREEIDESFLRRLASPWPDGRPRYRWIGDKEELESHFVELAGRISRD